MLVSLYGLQRTAMAIGPGGTPTIPPRNVFHEAEAAEQDEEQAAKASKEQAAKKANEVAVKALMLCMMCRSKCTAPFASSFEEI